MKRSTRILLGVLGAAHLLVAIALLPVATFFGLLTVPVILPGLIWLVILGVRLFRPNTRIRRALRVTHSILALLSALLVVYGVHCLQAARHSAEGGGGILGAVGLIPIVMGALAGSLSVASLCLAFSSTLPKTTDAEHSLGGDSRRSADGLTGAPQG